MNFIQRFLVDQLDDFFEGKASDSSVAFPTGTDEFGSELGGLGGFESYEYALDVALRRVTDSSWARSNIALLSTLGGSADALARERISTTNRFRPVSDHPALKVLRNPNDMMSRTWLMRYSISWMLVTGEVFWRLRKDKSGELVEIWPLPSIYISPVAHPTQYISGFQYQTPDMRKPITYRRDQIFYVHEPSIVDYHGGWGRLAALKKTVQTDSDAAKWNAETFKKESPLRTIISVSEHLNSNKFRAIKAEIEHQLNERGRRFIIARSGTIDAKSIGLTQKDMDYLGGRSFNRAEIDRIFSVPPAFWSEQASKANTENANSVVHENVHFMLQLIADQFTNNVARKLWDTSGEVYFEDIRPRNREMDLKENMYLHQAMTINEVRMTLGEPPYQSTYGDLPWPMRDKPAILQMYFASDAQLGLEPAVYDLPTSDDDGSTANTNSSGTADGEIMAADGVNGANNGISPTDDNKIQREMAREVRAAFSSVQLADLAKWRKKAGRMKTVEGMMEFESTVLPVWAKGLLDDLIASSPDTHIAGHRIDDVYNLAAGKATVPLQFGNAELDSILSRYYDSIEDAALTARAAGQPPHTLSSALRTATIAAVTAAILAGRGETRSTPLTLEEEQTVSELLPDIVRSADNLADEISRGGYDPDSGVLGGVNVYGMAAVAGALVARLSLWVGTISGTFWRSMVGSSEDDVRLVWLRGATVEACTTCATLNGQVKTAGEWAQLPYRPQARDGSLACGGWRCDCRFEVVT